MAVYYDSEQIYLQSKSTIAAKVSAIDDLIDALFLQMAAVVGTSNIEEYQLNDGQTTIRTKYRSPEQITATINVLEQMRNRYENRLNGRIARGVDSKNFRNGRIR